MNAGMAKCEITPQEPMRMAGFDRRASLASGTLDPLYVTALAMQDDQQQLFLLCSFDLLGTNRQLCQNARQAVCAALGLDESRIWIFATHTHSAPSVAFSPETEYAANLVIQCAQAARQAVEDLQPARCSYAAASAIGVASLRNRGRSGASHPMPLLLTRFMRKSDTIAWSRLACHPTVLDEQNQLYSKDLPGAVAADGRWLFANGACADVSTRFTRRASSPEELRRLGGVIGQAIAQAAWKPDDTFGQTIYTAQKDIFLERSASLGGSELAALLSAFRQKAAQCDDVQARREYDAIIAVLEREGVSAEPRRPIRIAAADFGPYALLSLPFEVDSADGSQLEQLLCAAAQKDVYLLCYAGGYDGYLPSGKPLSAESSYEDIASRYLPKARDAVWEGAKQCILQATQG